MELRWTLVDFSTASMHVRRIKKGTPSTHPVLEDELRALRRLQREQEPRSPFVFTSERGAPFSTAGFVRMVERAGGEAKLGVQGAPAHAPARLRLGTSQQGARYEGAASVPRAVLAETRFECWFQCDGRPSISCCSGHSAGKSMRRATPIPCGSRPSMAANKAGRSSPGFFLFMESAAVATASCFQALNRLWTQSFSLSYIWSPGSLVVLVAEGVSVVDQPSTEAKAVQSVRTATYARA